MVNGDNLRRNHTVSCGCQKKESAQKRVIDLVGMKFGKLTVKQKTKNPYPNNRHTYWLCDCDCGNKNILVDGENLKTNKISSCGCLDNSKGEYKIIELLKQHNIEFEKEKTFENCVFPDTLKRARFDFYLPEFNLLIEFDGIQHFNYSEWGWNSQENFIKTQEHDKFKNEWCKNNNISIIRIPYTHLSTLKIEDLLENSRFMI